MIAAMTARTMGSREVTAWAVSRLIGAVPVSSACRPAGTGHGLQPVELRLGGLRVQRCAAGDGQKGTAVADRGCAPMAARQALPATNVPPGADTDDTVGHLGELCCVASQFGGADPGSIRDDDRHVRRQVVSEIGAELITDLARRGRCR